MPITGLNPDKCRQRNSVAAKRDGVNAVPMNFLKGAVSVGMGATNALGTLPTSDADALARINALRGEDALPLTLEQVYIHYAEAANSSFIPDRFAFLSTKTLKNIARDAQTGYAFMNSHRTGGLSHESELPYGRTFAGRYEKASDGSERALIGFYMLQGQYPNGRSGPSTDDLHMGIDGGTLFDVSVGLYGGQMLCDVCGSPLDDYEDCYHVPGTDYDMTDTQQAAQRARGVTDGLASYTIDDAHCGETSAVFDGAVPGAGFKKALAMQRQGRFTPHTLAQARHAYAPLLAKGDLPMDGSGIASAIENALTAVFTRFGLKEAPAHSVQNAHSAQGGHSARGGASAASFTPTDTAGDPLLGAQEENESEGAKSADAPPAPHAPDASSEPADSENDISPSETAAPAAHDPVLLAARQAGIETPAHFAQMQQEAQDGRAYLAEQRETAKKYATVAFGSATDKARKEVQDAHDFLATAARSQVKLLCANYKTLAVKLGLMNEGDKPQPRQSASAQLPNFALDAQTTPETKPVELASPADSFARRKEQTEASTRRR